MDDDKIIMRGGTQNDIEEISMDNGADFTKEDWGKHIAHSSQIMAIAYEMAGLISYKELHFIFEKTQKIIDNKI